MTLKGPVNQDQLTKIKEILKNPWIYKDKVQMNQYPVLGEYTKSFSKFHPQKVEVNEQTFDDVIRYGMHLRSQNWRWLKQLTSTRPSEMTLTTDWRNSQLTLHNKKTNDYLLDINSMHTSALYKRNRLFYHCIREKDRYDIPSQYQ